MGQQRLLPRGFQARSSMRNRNDEWRGGGVALPFECTRPLEKGKPSRIRPLRQYWVLEMRGLSRCIRWGVGRDNATTRGLGAGGELAAAGSHDCPQCQEPQAERAWLATK